MRRLIFGALACLFAASPVSAGGYGSWHTSAIALRSLQPEWDVVDPGPPRDDDFDWQTMHNVPQEVQRVLVPLPPMRPERTAVVIWIIYTSPQEWEWRDRLAMTYNTALKEVEYRALHEGFPVFISDDSPFYKLGLKAARGTIGQQERKILNAFLQTVLGAQKKP